MQNKLSENDKFSWDKFFTSRIRSAESTPTFLRRKNCSSTSLIKPTLSIGHRFSCDMNSSGGANIKERNDHTGKKSFLDHFKKASRPRNRESRKIDGSSANRGKLSTIDGSIAKQSIEKNRKHCDKTNLDKKLNSCKFSRDTQNLGILPNQSGSGDVEICGDSTEFPGRGPSFSAGPQTMQTSTPEQFPKKWSKSAIKLAGSESAKLKQENEKKISSSFSVPQISRQVEFANSEEIFHISPRTKEDLTNFENFKEIYVTPEEQILPEKYSTEKSVSNFFISPIHTNCDKFDTKQKSMYSSHTHFTRESIWIDSSDIFRKEILSGTRENSVEADGSKFAFLLQVHLKEGKDLVIRDSSGTSDPYVKFKYQNKTIYKSCTVFKNLNPQWDERFVHVIDDPSAQISLDVYDYDRFGTDDYMGSAILNLSEISHFKPMDLKLSLGRPKSTEYMGYLLMQVGIVPITAEEQMQFVKKRLSPEGSSSKKVKTLAHGWSSVVNIVLIEAKNLHDSAQGNFPPDPYVRFKLGPEKYKSKVVAKNGQPKWLEQFDLHIFDDQTCVLEISVFDKRKDYLIGKCSVDLSGMERETTHHEWYSLDEGAAGQIFLLISISGTSNFFANSATFSDELCVEESKSLTDRQILLDQYSLVKTHKNIWDVGILTVKVVKAQGLASADIGGKSDPFCVLELVNARVQTHTEYKTLCPEWNKSFTFTVKDINSTLDVTVFDEDSNKKVEFLGRVAIPLLKVPKNDKKWYALKDKKLQHRAKGKLLLDFDLVWNPIRAAIRTCNPKERKYMFHEEKFKRQIFIRNALRVKSMIKEIVEILAFCQSCWSWESPVRSASTFVIFIVATYFAELYMLPIMLLCLFLKSCINRSISEKLKTTSLEEYAESDSEEEFNPSDDKEEKIGFMQRLISIQDTLAMVQNALDYIASTIERIKNTFNFTVPFLSLMAIFVLCFSSIILYILPLRWIVMLWGINKFTKKLRNQKSVPNNELLDFLSRVPCDDEIRKYAEFRPEAINGSTSTTGSMKSRKKLA